jgi:predicted ABC-type ATPase
VQDVYLLLIAAGLSPFAPDRAAIRAGRLMLAEIRRRIRSGTSFAFETMLSGRGYAQLITQWRAAGYYVKLIYINLPTPDLAVARVNARVAQGGHGVPESVIRRRFDASLLNFTQLYCDVVDLRPLKRCPNTVVPVRSFARGALQLSPTKS